MKVEDLLAYQPRKWYRRVPFVSDQSHGTLLDENGNRKLTPEASANFWNWLVFSWLNELIALGYSRPFGKDELYLLPDTSDASRYASTLDAHLARLRAKTDLGPSKKVSRLPTFSSLSWRLARALNATVFSWFWIGGVVKLLADSATICSPLLVRAIIRFLQRSEDNRYAGLPEPSLGRGMGLAIGLATLLAFGVLANVHGFYRGYTSGILLRGALIDSLFRRATKLSPLDRAKYDLEASRIVSMISTDVSRLDFGMGYFHSTWTSAVQILICLGLTVSSLGPSALAGFALIAILVPTQSVITKHLFALRKKSMPFTDARLSAINQALGAIRLVKTYAWEDALLRKIGALRVRELSLLRDRLLWRALNLALSFSVPTLAAVVSFVTYAALGHALDAAEIFASLTLFMLLRTPLQLLPVALGAQSDAAQAIQRLSRAFDAPEPNDDVAIDESLGNALELDSASFSYRVNDEHVTSEESREKPEQTENKDFNLSNIDLHVRRGELLVIVGPVGSGKSTLLSSLVGETRREGGRMVLGSQHAYAPQNAWLKSASIQDNIVFGREWDAERYQEVLQKCCLAPDMAALAEGDSTVIGERGISLSGGQRQRVALARTIYQPRRLLLLDDVFSALDAHVQAVVFDRVVTNRPKDTSIVLVTHSLHLLRYADRICCMSQGQIAEMGTFSELMVKPSGETRRLVEEFASRSVAEAQQEKERKKKEDAIRRAKGEAPHSVQADGGEQVVRLSSAVSDDNPATGAAKSGVMIRSAEDKVPSGKAVMQSEERFVGSVSMRTYKEYIRRGKPLFTLSLWVLSILIFQGGSILSPLWLQWWQEARYKSVSSGVYMGVYAALGITQALGLLFMSAAFSFFVFYSSAQLHAGAIRSVLFAPIAFFDTTPLGRILHRFSKDTDTVDNVVGEALRMFFSTTAQVIGAIVLIAIILPWFLLAVAVVVVLFVLTSMYYRPAARELRRLDALLRSPIYEHATESLAGIMVIRSLGALQTTVDRNTQNLNKENSAYWLSVACQRWFSVRLDLLGTLLVLLVGIIVVANRSSISAAQGGVALSYIVTVQSVFGYMIRQSAEIEQNMNAIERLLYYSSSVTQEPPQERENDDKLRSRQWPEQGLIEMEDLVFTYREGLQPSLKGLNVRIPSGSRVALVGRTGSGKSTMLAALTRMGEIQSGRILIDGVDTSSVGLKLLRDNIAFMPQEAAVLSGTLRYNLDPFGEHDDAHLWRIVHQVGLSAIAASESGISLDSLPGVDEKTAVTSKSGASQSHHLALDTPILAEGANLSSGQRSLISLARALVKNASIFVLDEATASMDADLDHHVQQILRSNLQGKTMIVVAHRLDSIIGSSDFICVLDDGKIAQFGAPLELHQANGLFRELCTNAAINADDILASRERFHGR